MRIYDQNLTGPAVNETGRSHETQRTTGSGSGGASATSGTGDRVEFSDTLGRLSRAIASDESNRAGRVDQLTAQYASGNYALDPAAISHGIVSDALAGAH